MSVYNISRKFKAGEFKFDELENADGECLELDYDEEYQLLTYEAPMIESEVRVYTVPRDKVPDELTAVYDKNGTLEKVMIPRAGEPERLLYMWFEDIMKSERAVLKYIKEQADKISKEIIGRKRKLSRLFFGRFYDGEAVELAVRIATAEEMQAVIDEYHGDLESADNSGNYSVEKMMTVEYEPLAVMLMCTSNLCGFRDRLFNKAAEALEERIKSRVLDKIEKNKDFKVISEEYD